MDSQLQSRLFCLRRELGGLRGLPLAPVEPTCVALDPSPTETAIGTILAPLGVAPDDVKVDGLSSFVQPSSHLQFSISLRASSEHRTSRALRTSSLERITAVEASLSSTPESSSASEPAAVTLSVNPLRPCLDVAIAVPSGTLVGSILHIASVHIAGHPLPGFPVDANVTRGMRAPLNIRLNSPLSLLTPCISVLVSRVVFCANPSFFTRVSHD
jgi:hypothetical protein